MSVLQVSFDPPQPPNENPFVHDIENMGKQVGNNFMILFREHEDTPATFLKIVHIPSGEIIRIRVDEDKLKELLVKQYKNPIKASYPEGKCPDCLSEIPDYVTQGEHCIICGHVFCLPQEDDDLDYPDMTSIGKEEKLDG